jgi:hypothetical protein
MDTGRDKDRDTDTSRDGDRDTDIDRGTDRDTDKVSKVPYDNSANVTQQICKLLCNLNVQTVPVFVKKNLFLAR